MIIHVLLRLIGLFAVALQPTDFWDPSMLPTVQFLTSTRSLLKANQTSP